MSKPSYSIAAVVEKFRDFDRVAAQLDMPGHERLNILNVSDEVYELLRAGDAAKIAGVRPELERRLTYALPLMRRLAQAQAQEHPFVPAMPAGAGLRMEAAAA